MSDEKKGPDSSDTFYLPAEDDEALRRAMRVPIARTSDPAAETLVPCPWCEGHGMVTPEKAGEWRSAYPELSKKAGEVA